jgi:aminobenzoyl-glutamate transport protein
MQVQKSRTLRFLDGIERVGNRLPDPFVLFLIFAAMVLLASWIFAGTAVIDPKNGKELLVQNLLSLDGIRRIFTDAVKNFANFPPLATVLVVMMGVGIAEQSGLFSVGLKRLMEIVPKSIATAALVFAGVNSSMAADAGIVILPPLGAMLFVSLGRHPLAGLAAAFAGVSGGFSANLLVTSLDPLLAGITQSAAQLVSPGYTVAPTANWYFMIASTFLVTIVGTAVTAYLIEPRLGSWAGNGEQGTGNGSDAERPKAAENGEEAVSPQQRRALVAAIVAALFGTGLFVLMVVGGVFPEEKAFYESIVAMLTILFALSGVVFGVMVSKIKTHRDAVQMSSDTMASMGGYLLLAFAAAQFIAYFNWSNLGIVLAVKGAGVLRELGLTGGPLLVGFMVVAAFINLLISSASAKWALLAPIFVPMMMLLGYSPEVAQAAYRVGDSTTNIITPLMPYFPILVTLAKKYVPDAGLGTLLSLMVPYSVAFGISWALMFLLWNGLGLPLGPGAPLTYVP